MKRRTEPRIPADRPRSRGRFRPISQVVQERLARRTAPSTTQRWIRSGVLVNGQRIRLKALRAWGVWCTTDEWFDAFLAAQTAAALGPHGGAEKVSERDPETERRLKEDRLI